MAREILGFSVTRMAKNTMYTLFFIRTYFIRTSRLRFGQIFVLEYIWLFQKKAYIMECNLKQSLKGYGGRNLRITRLKLRKIDARRKKHCSYKKTWNQYTMIGELLGFSVTIMAKNTIWAVHHGVGDILKFPLIFLTLFILL